jgi:MerR family transcriptional regulator, thiopeptide resistance regulator
MMIHTTDSISIGKLAQLCGVTVRTLQYYDRSGLLPASFNRSGRREYSGEDLIKLQQILFLKSLGFPLKKINGNLLKTGNLAELGMLFNRQKKILIKQKNHLERTINALDMLIGESEKGRRVSIEKMMAVLEVMKQENPWAFIIWYFNDGQLEKIAKDFSSSGKYQTFMDSFTGLFAELQLLYNRHADPSGPEAQRIAAGWWNMVSRFSNGDSEILNTLVKSGQDMDNWPDETEPMKKVFQELLAPALGYYFKQNNIMPDGNNN